MKRFKVCPSVRLSVCPSVRLSVCPSVRLSVCLSVCLVNLRNCTYAFPRRCIITFYFTRVGVLLLFTRVLLV